MFLAGAALGACTLTAPFTPTGGGTATGRIVAQQVTLANGITVTGPAGFCVDTSQIRETPTAASVLMASCANLGGKLSAGAVHNALIVATVVPGSHGDLAGLERSLRDKPSKLGATTLHDINRSSVAVYANISQTGSAVPEGAASRHWKALFDLAGAAVLLSVYGPEDGTLAGDLGEDLTRDGVQTLLDANSGARTVQNLNLAVATETNSQDIGGNKNQSGLGLGARLANLIGR